MPKKLQALKQRYTDAGDTHAQRIKYVVKKPLFSIPFATLMVFLVAVMVLFVTLNTTDIELQSDNVNTVIVDHDDTRQTIPTRAKTVGALLERMGLTLNPGDVVEPSLSAEIVGDNFRVNVYRAVPVTIIDGDKRTYTQSAASTARSIVKQADIQVYPEDWLELIPTENFLEDSSIGERVVINRSTPINMNLYGTPTVIRTHAKTVGELLKEKKIELREGDSVVPADNTPLAANTQVFVLHRGKQIQTQEQDIAMPVENINDPNLSYGSTAVRQQGAPGKKLVTYEVELQNGLEIGRRVIQEVVSVEPVKQIVAKGTFSDIPKDRTAVLVAAGVSPADFDAVNLIFSGESGWRPGALNASGCAGLGQACPGSKLANACPNWQNDPVCQTRFFAGYASRYGGWQGAAAVWQRQHWW